MFRVTSPTEAVMSTCNLLDTLSHVFSHHGSASTPDTFVQFGEFATAVLHSLLIVISYSPFNCDKCDIIYALIDIVKSPNSPPRSIKDALKALFRASLSALNRSTWVWLGFVVSLFGLLLKEGRVGLVEAAGSRGTDRRVRRE
ncbi:uncharacterized protein LOC115676831 [Syzygium oleosum]|uniref:uncharacterized protein LOC115676831 n=1 Tax=Syzygium oleosum TaxID=219896 RepID=UPI0011D2AAF2|nr:uncharacterized protein LOC115676831 [Syzygium oleosum]